MPANEVLGPSGPGPALLCCSCDYFLTRRFRSLRLRLLIHFLESCHHVLVNTVGLLMKVSDLQLGLDIYLVFNIRAHLVFFRLAVLTDKYEASEEDCFQRDNHSEQAKGKRIESAVAKNESVERYPDNKPESMGNQEGHAAAKPCQPVGNPL